MLLKNKIVPIALVAALLGGSVGAIVSRRNPETATASTSTAPAANLLDSRDTRQATDVGDPLTADQTLAAKAEDVDDPASYRAGFLDGFFAARDGNAAARNVVVERAAAPRSRVVYRNTRGRNYSRSNYDSSRRVYYDYNQQPRKRSFWQKHRDKLTVAMGAGGGALIGGLLGGKKGAAIGALAGGGGSALWTYKLRKRNRNY